MTHRSFWLITTTTTLALSLPGCMGEHGMDDGIHQGETTVCTSGTSCCTKEELMCKGDPDGTMVCTCHKSWDCDKVLSPEKCNQSPADTPDGKSGWVCKVNGMMELCIRPGDDVPPGTNGWKCKSIFGHVECSRQTNTPDGSNDWDCTYNGEFKQCNKNKNPKKDSGPQPLLDGSIPPPPPPPPPKDGGAKKDSGKKKDSTVPPKDTGTPFIPPPGWTCNKGPNGETICKKPDSGLPPGNGTFKCYWKNGMITCEGSSPNNPGGNGWNCVKHEDVGGWRCKKSVGPGDTPGGNGTWNCTSNSADGGTTCIQNPPPAKPGAECLPGTKMWCDGHSYCGWGQVVCGADGKWKRKFNWKAFKWELDCWEFADGRRPNTACACYFFYYNKDCCETVDCIVPPGTNGQICPASPGWYCDYCNPQKPECKEGSAKCVTTSNNESFCGKDCAGGKPCPAGSKCQSLQQSGQTLWQCMPNDLSCYY